MEYLNDETEVAQLKDALAKDAYVERIGHIAFQDKHVTEGSFHQGHKFFISKVREKCDVIIGHLVPNIDFPDIVSNDPTLPPDDRVFTFQPKLMYPDKKMNLTVNQVDAVKSVLMDGLDYFFTLPSYGGAVKAAMDYASTQEFIDQVSATGLPAPLLDKAMLMWFHVQGLQASVSLDSWLPELASKLYSIQSIKNAWFVFSMMKYHETIRGKVNFPVPPFFNRTTVPAEAWLAPVYRVADGLIPEPGEPSQIRDLRLLIKGIVGAGNYVTVGDLTRALFPLIDSSFSMCVLVKDYTTFEQWSDIVDDNPDTGHYDSVVIPSFGEIKVSISHQGKFYETYDFLGLQDWRWIDARLLMPFD